MRDPYNVIGTGRDATDDEIKKRYRSLCRKYHPDLNPGNKAAEEMFKEVQQAYQQIMDERKNGISDNPFSAGFGGSTGQTGSSSQHDLHMTAALNYIQSGHYPEALHVLDEIPEHTARWYYFYAVASSGMGNNVAAQKYAETAVRMEPGNYEYQGFLQRFRMGQEWYQERQQPYRSFSMGSGGCMNPCLTIMCCNMLCGGRVCFC